MLHAPTFNNWNAVFNNRIQVFNNSIQVFNNPIQVLNNPNQDFNKCMLTCLTCLNQPFNNWNGGFNNTARCFNTTNLVFNNWNQVFNTWNPYLFKMSYYDFKTWLRVWCTIVKGRTCFSLFKIWFLFIYDMNLCVLVQFDISPVHTWGSVVEKLILPVQGLMHVCQDINIYSCLMQTNKIRYHMHSIAYSNWPLHSS